MWWDERPSRGGARGFGAGLYGEGEREGLPEKAQLASLGCENPTAAYRNDSRRRALAPMLERSGAVTELVTDVLAGAD